MVARVEVSLDRFEQCGTPAFDPLAARTAQNGHRDVCFVIAPTLATDCGGFIV